MIQQLHQSNYDDSELLVSPSSKPIPSVQLAPNPEMDACEEILLASYQMPLQINTRNTQKKHM